MRQLAWLLVVALACGCGDDEAGSAGAGGAGGTGTAGTGGGGTGGSGGRAPLRDEYVLSNQNLVPESGSFDETTRSFYVGSATEGSITRIEADGSESIFFEPPSGEQWRTLGMTVDVDARRLWVCAQETAPGVRREIWVFDVDDQERDLALDLVALSEDATCNDIAVDGEGLAYVSDSENPWVYRADAALEQVVIWADDPLLAPEGAQFGGNGIAVTEDDAWVLLSKTLTTAAPRFLRIERTSPANIMVVTTTPNLEGFADGMSFLDGALYLAIGNPGGIFKLQTDDQWLTATITRTAAVAGTSTVRPAEGRLYGIYSDITSAITMQPLNPPFRIFRVELNSFE